MNDLRRTKKTDKSRRTGGQSVFLLAVVRLKTACIGRLSVTGRRTKHAVRCPPETRMNRAFKTDKSLPLRGRGLACPPTLHPMGVRARLDGYKDINSLCGPCACDGFRAFALELRRPIVGGVIGRICFVAARSGLQGVYGHALAQSAAALPSFLFAVLALASMPAPRPALSASPWPRIDPSALRPYTATGFIVR